MFGAFDPAAGLSRPAFVTYMALAGLGTLLTAAYLLIVVRRVCMGDPKQPALVPDIADLRPYEAVSWTPLAALHAGRRALAGPAAGPLRPGREAPPRGWLTDALALCPRSCPSPPATNSWGSPP